MNKENSRAIKRLVKMYGDIDKRVKDLEDGKVTERDKKGKPIAGTYPWGPASDELAFLKSLKKRIQMTIGVVAKELEADE